MHDLQQRLSLASTIRIAIKEIEASGSSALGQAVREKISPAFDHEGGYIERKSGKGIFRRGLRFNSSLHTVCIALWAGMAIL